MAELLAPKPMKNRFVVYLSPLGYLRIEHRAERLTLLKIEQGEPQDFGAADDFSDMVYAQLMEYVKGERRSFDLEIDLGGCTSFQQRVLNELLKIPYGQTRSYKDIAAAIGRPSASRAVGMANNRNPIHIVVPCHRVVGSRGALTGYAAGVETKAFLLDLERLSL